MVEPYPATPEPPTGPVALDRPQRGATIVQAYARYWQKYAVFKGRASRSEFWWVILANAIIGIVLGAIFRGDARVVSLLWDLATIVPSIALNARRLHDIDKSGWWQLIGLIPIVGWIIVIVWFASRERPEGVRFDQ
jgi:uncharacterized membrane protein YhaH (DUF805 family)